MKHQTTDCRRSHRQRGLTLIEISFAVTLLALCFGTAWSAVSKSQNLFSDEMQHYVIGDTERRVMDHVMGYLRRAAPASVTPVVLADSSSIAFKQVIGVDADGLVLGPLITMSYSAPTGVVLGDPVVEGGSWKGSKGWEKWGEGSSEGGTWGGGTWGGDGWNEETQTETSEFESSTTPTLLPVVGGTVSEALRGQLVVTVEGQTPWVLAENILGVRFNSLANGVSVSIDVGRDTREGLIMQRSFTRAIGFRN